MVQSLRESGYPKSFFQEIAFPSQAQARGMRGSGVVIFNLPFGLEPALSEVYTILKGK
jgi:23S rRNA A2030 N6-methylase RlmJ